VGATSAQQLTSYVKEQVKNSLTASIQHFTESSSHCNKGRKRNKKHPYWKKGGNTVFAHDIVVYIESIMEYAKKLNLSKKPLIKIEKCVDINVTKDVNPCTLKTIIHCSENLKPNCMER
jgi:hypothetical protein